MSNTNHHPKKQGIPINVLLLLSFAFIAFVPVTILGIKIYNAAWDNAWREVREKHQLLAENLSAPIEHYVVGHQTNLSLVAHHVAELNLDVSSESDSLKKILADNMAFTSGFDALIVLQAENKIIAYVNDGKHPTTTKISRFDSHEFITNAIASGKSQLSPIVKNPFTAKPALYIAQPLGSKANPKHQFILLGELCIEPIEKLRKGIKFGEGGHSAIVDSNGRIIAHPNPNWMNKDIVDLSHLGVIQKMMAGETGVTEFFSPFKKYDMVAGYTSVPRLGWGIMVPQPKYEVENQVKSILFSHYGWGLLGLALALITAHYLGRWITQPLNELALSGSRLSKQNFKHNLPELRSSAPSEIIQVSSAFSEAINDLSASCAEIEDLNKGLQNKINEATTELRQANIKLTALSRMDHLTKLSNRRHFEQTIANLTTRRQSDNTNICLLLIDIDHFKEINDEYGHTAGDMVLVQVAEVLDRNTRQSDLAARYAGDEFILLIRAEAEIGRQRAMQIRTEIAEQKLMFDDHNIQVTVSIGLFIFDISQKENSMENVFRQVDAAMYDAKRSGRNTISELTVQP